MPLATCVAHLYEQLPCRSKPPASCCQLLAKLHSKIGERYLGRMFHFENDRTGSPRISISSNKYQTIVKNEMDKTEIGGGEWATMTVCGRGGVWERRCVRDLRVTMSCVCEYKPLNETVKSCNEL